MSEIKPINGLDDRVKLAEAIPLTTPFTFNVFPTNVCNFRCNYCGQSLGQDELKRKYNFEPETLTMDIFKTAVSQAQLFPQPFKLVSMMGHGEPLVNPHVPEMVELVKRSNIANRIDIITNASLLNHTKSLELIDAGLDVIRISLQGLSSLKYQEISQVKLDFDEFIENIAFFHQHRKKCQVFVKIMDISLEPDQSEMFYKMFNNISDRMYIEKVKPVYDGVPYEAEGNDSNIDRYGNMHEKRLVCPQPFYMLSLWPNGDIAPCDAIYKPNTLGNVREGNLRDMWNSISLNKFRCMQLEKKRNAHDACNKCCAPDDVSHLADVLDPYSTRLLEVFNREVITNG